MSSAMITIMLLLSPLLPLAASEGDCQVIVRGLVKSPAVAPQITVSLSKESVRCLHSPHQDELCRISVECNTRHLAFLLTSPGHKKYVRNWPDLRFLGKIADVDLGELELTASEAPRVLQTLRSQGADGAVRFEVVLHNPLAREVLVREVAFMARREGTQALCAIGGVAIFEVGPTLEVHTTAGKGLSVVGTFQELTRSEGYRLQAAGELYYQRCGGAAQLELRMRSAFTIPPSEYSGVEIRLPAKFQCAWQGGSFLADPDLLGLADPRSYDQYLFELVTSDGSELPIVATYR